MQSSVPLLVFEPTNRGTSFDVGIGVCALGSCRTLIHVPETGDEETDTAPRTARRLVASWNACRSIPVEELERGIVAELLDACAEASRELFIEEPEHLALEEKLYDLLRRAGRVSPVRVSA